MADTPMFVVPVDWSSIGMGMEYRFVPAPSRAAAEAMVVNALRGGGTLSMGLVMDAMTAEEYRALRRVEDLLKVGARVSVAFECTVTRVMGEEIMVECDGLRYVFKVTNTHLTPITKEGN